MRGTRRVECVGCRYERLYQTGAGLCWMQVSELSVATSPPSHFGSYSVRPLLNERLLASCFVKETFNSLFQFLGSPPHRHTQILLLVSPRALILPSRPITSRHLLRQGAKPTEFFFCVWVSSCQAPVSMWDSTSCVYMDDSK